MELRINRARPVSAFDDESLEMYWVAFHDTDIFDLIQHNEILLSLDIIQLNRNSFLYLQISISDAIVTLLLHRRYIPQRCVTKFQCIFLLFENEIYESFINRHRCKFVPRLH